MEPEPGKIKIKPYVPKRGTASYAILVEMYFRNRNMKKDEIGELAQRWADKEIHKKNKQPVAGQKNELYDGWSNMKKQLLERELVGKKNATKAHPFTEYFLMEKGKVLAAQLIAKDGLNDKTGPNLLPEQIILPVAESEGETKKQKPKTKKIKRTNAYRATPPSSPTPFDNPLPSSTSTFAQARFSDVLIDLSDSGGDEVQIPIQMEVSEKSMVAAVGISKRKFEYSYDVEEPRMQEFDKWPNWECTFCTHINNGNVQMCIFCYEDMDAELKERPNLQMNNTKKKMSSLPIKSSSSSSSDHLSSFDVEPPKKRPTTTASS